MRLQHARFGSRAACPPQFGLIMSQAIARHAARMERVSDLGAGCMLLSLRLLHGQATVTESALLQPSGMLTSRTWLLM